MIQTILLFSTTFLTLTATQASELVNLKTLRGQRDLPISASFALPPFVFQNAEEGKFQGLEIDVLNIMAAHLDLTYVLRLEPTRVLPNNTILGTNIRKQESLSEYTPNLFPRSYGFC